MNQQKSWNCVGLVRAIAEEQMCLIKSFSKKKNGKEFKQYYSVTHLCPANWVGIYLSKRKIGMSNHDVHHYNLFIYISRY